MAESHVAELRPVVTRQHALAAGLERYFTGNPCKYGHINERYAQSRVCLECRSALNAAAHLARQSDPSRRVAKNANGRVYYRANAEKIRDYRRIYWTLPHVKARERAQYATPMGTLNGRMSVRIRRSFYLGGEGPDGRSTKSGRTWESLVGYTVAALLVHIERQFLKGMSWKNRSRWHIDHITPLALFNFTSADDAEFKAAWALTNLRPLWKEKNIAKGAKREFLL